MSARGVSVAPVPVRLATPQMMFIGDSITYWSRSDDGVAWIAVADESTGVQHDELGDYGIDAYVDDCL